MNLEELDVVLGGRSILNPREYNSLALAHIGDAVFEVLVRLTVLTDGNAPVNKLHKKARAIVNAKAQAEMYYRIQDILTEEEADVFRRGQQGKILHCAEKCRFDGLSPCDRLGSAVRLPLSQGRKRESCRAV